MKPKKKQEIFKAWAIDLGVSKPDKDDGRLHLAGRYWDFGWTLRHVLPIHLEGCRVALFTTRKIARDMMKAHVTRSLHPHLRVVRVEISIRDLGAY